MPPEPKRLRAGEFQTPGSAKHLQIITIQACCLVGSWQRDYWALTHCGPRALQTCARNKQWLQEAANARECLPVAKQQFMADNNAEARASCRCFVKMSALFTSVHILNTLRSLLATLSCSQRYCVCRCFALPSPFFSASAFPAELSVHNRMPISMPIYLRRDSSSQWLDCFPSTCRKIQTLQLTRRLQLDLKSSS